MLSKTNKFSEARRLCLSQCHSKIIQDHDSFHNYYSLSMQRIVYCILKKKKTNIKTILYFPMICYCVASLQLRVQSKIHLFYKVCSTLVWNRVVQSSSCKASKPHERLWFPWTSKSFGLGAWCGKFVLWASAYREKKGSHKTCGDAQQLKPTIVILEACLRFLLT